MSKELKKKVVIDTTPGSPDMKSNREMARAKLKELKERERRMAGIAKVYKRNGMVITVYGKGPQLSAAVEPVGIEKLRLEIFNMTKSDKINEEEHDGQQ